MNNKIDNFKKWHDSKTTIILLLVFIHPVGLLGLWLRKKTASWKKIVISIPFPLFILLIIAGILLPSPYYYDAIKDINNKEYLSAYSNLLKVNSTDENFEKAQIKIKEIDSLAQEQALTILKTIPAEYEEVNQIILTKKIRDARNKAEEIINLYENISIFYKEAKKNDTFKNLKIIEDIKKSDVEQIIDSINSTTFISKSLSNLSDKQFIKLQKDSLTLQIIDNSALNYILLSKLKENSNLRDEYLNQELLKIVNGDLNEYIKYQVGELSIDQFKKLNNNELDTLIIKENSKLNSLLLSKMKKKSNLREEYLNDKLLEIIGGNLDEYIKLQVRRLPQKQFKELQNGTFDTLIIDNIALNSLLLSKMTVESKEGTTITIRKKEQNGDVIWLDEKHGYFIDIRDMKKYKVVKIGNQVFMSENLAYKPKYGNFWVYNNYKSNLSVFGYLYDWKTAQNVAPHGWHLPSKKEWLILYNFLGGDWQKVYKALLKGGSSEFNALLGSYRDNDGTFGTAGKSTNYWSSTKKDNISACGLFLLSVDSSAGVYCDGFRKNGYSLRFIKN